MTKGLMVITSMLLILACWLGVASSEEPLRREPSLLVLECLIYECADQPLEGQIAVAHTIIRRAEERGLSYEEVVLEPYQFSCFNEGVPQRNYTTCELDTASYVWASALASYQDNKDWTPNLYHADYVSPSWADAPRVQYLYTIGDHVFYREER